MAQPWHLVGRGAELAEASAALQSSTGVVISGAAGVGKTRLAHELCAAPRDDGLNILRLVGSRVARDIPLAAFAPLLGRHDAPVSADDPGRDLISSLVAHAFRLLDTLTKPDQPQLLMVVDDAQWLDASSATLLLQAALMLPVKLIVTVRTGEPAPDAVRRLWRDGGCARLDLHRLSPEDVSTLLRAELGVVEANTLLRLDRLCRGNPLLLRELIMDAIDAGVLECLDGVWQWRGRLRTGRRLADVVADRLAQLTEDEHAAVVALAFGEPLRPHLAEQLVGAAMLRSLEGRGVITVDAFRDGLVRLEHPLYGEVLQQTTGALQQIDAERRLVWVLEQDGSDSSGLGALRLARLAVATGERVSPVTLTTACDLAYAQGDVDESIRFGRAAVEGGGGTPAAIALGRSLAGAGMIDAADTVLRGVVADPAATPEQRSRAATSLLYVLEFDPDRFPYARELADTLLAELPEGDVHDRVAAHWAGLLTMGGRYAEAAECVTPLLDSTVAEVVLRATSSQCGVLIAAGRCREAVDCAAAQVPVAARNRDTMPDGLQWISSWLLTSMYFDGRVDDAQRLIAVAESMLAAEERPGMLGNDFIAATLGGARARFDVLCGDIDRARVELVAAVTSFRASDPQSWLPLVAAMLAETYAYLGDAKQSVRAAALANEQGPILHFRSFEADRCLAWPLVVTRDLRAAIAHLRRSARDARRDHHLAAETFALHDLSRLGDAHWAARRFDELAEDWDSRWRQPFLDHAHGLRGSDATRLEAAANAFEDMGAWLWAAEAWAGSHAAADRSGLVVRASSAAQRGLDAMSRCTGNVRTPALEPLLSRVRLTTREREVASLAAIGTSSKSIAAELGISARTVDNLLSRAYAKTGVNNRRDLGEVLGLEETG